MIKACEAVKGKDLVASSSPAAGDGSRGVFKSTLESYGTPLFYLPSVTYGDVLRRLVSGIGLFSGNRLMGLGFIAERDLIGGLGAPLLRRCSGWLLRFGCGRGWCLPGRLTSTS